MKKLFAFLCLYLVIVTNSYAGGFWGNRGHHGHHNQNCPPRYYGNNYYNQPVIYRASPTYYVPAPVIYTPPPVYYTPPQTYYTPPQTYYAPEPYIYSRPTSTFSFSIGGFL